MGRPRVLVASNNATLGSLIRWVHDRLDETDTTYYYSRCLRPGAAWLRDFGVLAGQAWVMLGFVDEVRLRADAGHAAWIEPFNEMFAQVAGEFATAAGRRRARAYPTRRRTLGARSRSSLRTGTTMSTCKPVMAARFGDHTAPRLSQGCTSAETNAPPTRHRGHGPAAAKRAPVPPGPFPWRSLSASRTAPCGGGTAAGP